MSYEGYLFDSDSLIVAKNSYYSPEFCPAFWEFFLSGADKQKFHIIDKVADELKNGSEDDFLRQFVIVNEEKISLATETDSACVQKYSEIQNWAATIWSVGKKASSVTKALEVFAKETSADSWNVAYAAAHNLVVITNEKSEPNAQSKIKLPDAAIHLNVHVLKLHELMQIHSGPNFQYRDC